MIGEFISLDANAQIAFFLMATVVMVALIIVLWRRGEDIREKDFTREARREVNNTTKLPAVMPGGDGE